MSVTSAVPRHFALHCRQSGHHASYSSLPNPVPLHNCYPSMYKSLDLLVHPKIATMSDNTTHTEARFLVERLIELWIEFSDSAQFCSRQLCSASSVLLQWISKSWIKSMTVSCWLIVLLWMWNHQMTNYGYSIRYLALKYWYSDYHWWDLQFPLQACSLA